jgi:hypothetical protein
LHSALAALRGLNCGYLLVLQTSSDVLEYNSYLKAHPDLFKCAWWQMQSTGLQALCIRRQFAMLPRLFAISL